MDYFEISKAILAVAKRRHSAECFNEAVLAAMKALSSHDLGEEETKSCHELISDNLKNCSPTFNTQLESHLNDTELTTEEVKDEQQAKMEKWIDSTEMKEEDFELGFSWDDFITSKTTKVNRSKPHIINCRKKNELHCRKN